MTNDIITFTVKEKNLIPIFRNMEEAKARELVEVIERAYKPNPDKKVIQKLRNWLAEYPEIWTMVFDIGQTIEENLIKRMVPEEAAQLALEKNVEAIRHDLGYEETTSMEMMLIDNIVLSWLRCQWAEYRLLAYMGHDAAHTSVVAFWEKRLSTAQARYLKACETLAKIRRLALKNPLLQLNIATQSGQQVNVAGNVIHK